MKTEEMRKINRVTKREISKSIQHLECCRYFRLEMENKSAMADVHDEIVRACAMLGNALSLIVLDEVDCEWKEEGAKQKETENGESDNRI